MAITVNSGRAKRFMGSSISGEGAENTIVGAGWVGITASEANDKKVIALHDLLAHGIQIGVVFQATVPCTVTFTLANTGVAMSADPNIQNMAIWSNSITVSNSIVSGPLLFTACKVTFSAPGTLYMCAR